MRYITRDEAIRFSGLEKVIEAENDNAEFIRYAENDQTVMSCSQASFYDADGFIMRVCVWYEHDRDQYEAVEQLDELDWKIVGYTTAD